MKVLVIGDGGREHALVWLAAQSPLVEDIFYFGQNAGSLSEPKCKKVILPALGNSGITQFAEQHGVDLIIVGPEQPLVDGLVDACQEVGVPAFGPTKEAAQLEGSKSFAKEVMREAGVPTADAVAFSVAHIQGALDYATIHEPPVVIKADGLCGGRGSIVCLGPDEIRIAIDRCFVQREFGPAGEKILVEDFLVGHPALRRAELSILALVDIHGNFIMFPPAQDYKEVRDHDFGPNTGGMGSFAPVPWVTAEMMEVVGQTIFAPVIAEMKKRKTPFSGVLYAGLMWTADGPKVVEFNVRFGDPELQPLTMLLKTDLIPVLKKIADGESIADVKLEWKRGAAVCVVMASYGYPGSYVKGAEIKGFDLAGLGLNDRIQIFQAGTKFNDDKKIITAGGRVLGATALSLESPTFCLQEAARIAYSTVDLIRWSDSNSCGPQFRHDIAEDVPYILP